MRILVLSNLYPPHVQGGAEILAAHIVAGLEELGHEVLVLTGSHALNGSPAGKREVRIWRTLRSAPTAHFDRHRPLWEQLALPLNYYRRYHNPANAAELRRMIATTKPDLLYIWEITGIGVNSLLKTLPALDIPIVFHLGSYWLLYARSPQTEQSRLRARQLKQWLIGTISMPAYTSLIAVSETVRREYIRGGFDPQRIEVIHNGIAASFFTSPPTHPPEQRTTGVAQLLFVGRLRVEKGLLVLLKALALLAHEQGCHDAGAFPFHLNVFGDGDQVYISELHDFLREQRLLPAVTFHGGIAQDKLIQQYDLADIMLVPSLWQEPFGLVVAEAMARGLPVIASNIGGPAEIITHEVNGLLVEPGDERALAHAIQQLLSEPSKRAQLGEAARETAATHFTLQENARRVERHLQQALQQCTVSGR